MYRVVVYKSSEVWAMSFWDSEESHSIKCSVFWNSTLQYVYLQQNFKLFSIELLWYVFKSPGVNKWLLRISQLSSHIFKMSSTGEISQDKRLLSKTMLFLTFSRYNTYLSLWIIYKHPDLFYHITNLHLPVLYACTILYVCTYKVILLVLHTRLTRIFLFLSP